MNGRAVIMLVLAVVVGLGAMIVTRRLLVKDGEKVEETLEVLTAARDLKSEELLKPDLLRVTRMAKSAVPPGAFFSPKDVEDRWVQTAMIEGDVIVERKLGAKGSPPGLLPRIPQGMRAISVDVNEQSGVSGFVLPGHHVDVIKFENKNNKEAGTEARGETILQNILVLAAGQTFTSPEERSLPTRTVTLALTPDQIDILVAARSRGTLSLSLRGLNDHDIVERPAPKPSAEDEKARQQREEEEHRRAALEEEVARLKDSHAKQIAELKVALAKRAEPPQPRPAPPIKKPEPIRYVHLYRGMNGYKPVPLGGASVAVMQTAGTRDSATDDPAVSGPSLDVSLTGDEPETQSEPDEPGALRGGAPDSPQPLPSQPGDKAAELVPGDLIQPF
jgi:pilus assembly protein CpaB